MNAMGNFSKTLGYYGFRTPTMGKLHDGIGKSGDLPRERVVKLRVGVTTAEIPTRRSVIPKIRIRYKTDHEPPDESEP